MTSPDSSPTDSPHLQRRFGLLQATALNMSNMIGVGPFITIPLLMSAINGGGPQAMLGWVVSLCITIPDALVWSELGAAMPGSGGSYIYLREGFGRQTYGGMMAFLFIWQFILSGPLEIASGYIGFNQYLKYIWPGMSSWESGLVLVALGVANIALLYRKIAFIGKITIFFWAGTLLTVGTVMFTGAMHFDPKLAFDFPPGAFHFSIGFLSGLGVASRIGVYDYLGYYDVCYIGDEVRDPGKVIPRSIITSLLGVALIYFAMNLSIIGVVHWREFVPAEGNQNANFVVSLFMEKIYGSKVASLFTLMILLTTFASVFALLLGYSRIPYAAAQDGFFFKIFGRLHPRKNFPHVSLLVIGVISILCGFFSLDTVISALLCTRILVQFIGQIGALILLRRRSPDMPRPYKMWLYPLPCLVALVGWVFLFLTSGTKIINLSWGMLGLGLLFFFLWAKATKRWPFVTPTIDAGDRV